MTPRPGSVTSASPAKTNAAAGMVSHPGRSPNSIQPQAMPVSVTM